MPSRSRPARRPGTSSGAEQAAQLVAGGLVQLGAPIGAAGLGPSELVQRLEQLGLGVVVGPPPRVDVGRQVPAGEHRGLDALEQGDQPRAGRGDLQPGRQADPEVLVDAHEPDARPDPRQRRMID